MQGFAHETSQFFYAIKTAYDDRTKTAIESVESYFNESRPELTTFLNDHVMKCVEKFY